MDAFDASSGDAGSVDAINSSTPSCAAAAGAGSGLEPALVGKICLAALTSILQAAVLAGVGLYLGRAKILTEQGTKMLSTMSMKVLIPCMLFSRIMPSVDLTTVSNAWPMLALPAVYALIGGMLGAVVAAVFRAPDDFGRGTIAAIAFGNTSSIPVILLSVMNDVLSDLWGDCTGEVSADMAGSPT